VFLRHAAGIQFYCFLGSVTTTLVVAGLVTQDTRAQSAGQTLSAEQAGRKLYAEHVRPILEQRCQVCHNGVTRQGGLDLTTREGLLSGGSRGPAVVPGNAKDSLLYKLSTHQQQPNMPLQGEKLPDEKSALIALWIDLGALFDAPRSAGTGGALPSPGLVSNAAANPLFDKVGPVLETECLYCHGGKFKQAGLDISTREKLLRGSESHKDIVVPGNADASLLIKKIKHLHQPGMPYQRERLSDETIAIVAAWVDAKVPYSKDLQLGGAAERKASLHGSDHWAYQPPKRPPPPKVSNRAWARGPIDLFIAAEHEKRGLEPVPEADKPTLLRRVYLDLIGLPPTPEEIEAFLNDTSHNAYEKIVDDLLSRPAYGERWGRHWMDIWRYSDWYGWRIGGQVHSSQRNMWHWRDWIIEALNEDKGYDRMILEMLAGDEIAPSDPKTLRATGYLARSWYLFNRNAWLKETVEHTAAGFLATTLKCARCHDHKSDPIAQEEYYRFRAFFEPYDVRTDPLPGQPDGFKGLPRVFDSEPHGIEGGGPAIYAETYRLVGGDEKNPDKEHPLSPAVPEILGKLGEPIKAVQLPLEAYYPFIQPSLQRELLEQARREIEKAQAGVAVARQALAVAEQHVAAPQQHEDARNIAGQRFESELKPIFDRHCIACHGESYPRNEFRVLSVALLLEGGTEDGPGVIPGKSAQSPLIQRLRGDKEPRMPSGAAPLPKDEIERIARWIDDLPPAEPQTALRKAQEALALAEKKVLWSKANLASLQARISADNARFADPPAVKAEELAKAARDAERSAEILKADIDLLEAQQQLTDAFQAAAANGRVGEQVREKRVTVATRQLKAAQEALGKAKNEYTPIGKLYPKTSSGRRTALAGWMTRRDNPLTARVAVNHIWMRHFGEPLVASVEDFGVKAKPPSHPELLDWLAMEFMESKWSMKHMHRLMVTSSTYRMQSTAGSPNHPNISKDSGNRYLWRMNQRRMEAETLRDSLLFVAGELDRTIGGPELDHYAGQRSRRRSLYFTHTPSENMLFLKLFDLADAAGCYRRFESIVPQQALALSNSEMSFTQSRLLARKISDKVGDDSAQFVATAFERILARAPSTQEESESLKFLEQQTQLLREPTQLTRLKPGATGEVPASADPSLRARESLVHVLINRNEFVTIR
jgi:mono/diheme cytochrome c family protein